MTKNDWIGIGYTLGTGRLFCAFSDFQKWASEVLHRPLLTHEFADKELWELLRLKFEGEVK